jgi:hypothetical protein
MILVLSAEGRTRTSDDVVLLCLENSYMAENGFAVTYRCLVDVSWVPNVFDWTACQNACERQNFDFLIRKPPVR